jgi:hypothetical protein
MDMGGLDQRLAEHWRTAAQDLGIRVTAPVELTNLSGQPFACEVLVLDFGSPNGTLVLSPKTERRVRQNLRSLGREACVGGAGFGRAEYVRKHFVDELLDWGWSGKAGGEPSWYSERMPR